MFLVRVTPLHVMTLDDGHDEGSGKERRNHGRDYIVRQRFITYVLY